MDSLNEGPHPMKQWVTEIQAVDPRTADLKRWVGPNVPGDTEALAQQHCFDNGMGYCRVVGLFICEIPWSIAEQAVLLYNNRDN